MTKLEKVIKGLEHCLECGDGYCYESECPYYQNECEPGLKADALEVLKAQEGVKRGTWDERQVESDNIWTRRRFYCSCCGGWQTHGKTKFCPNCGAEMREEE